MAEFILAIDQGTTSTTAALVELHSLKFVGKVNQEIPQIFPRPGWAEHNLHDIWNSTQQVVRQLLKNHTLSAQKIACIGITNQRETVGAFTHKGIPLGNAIVWQDRRTTQFCQQLKASAQKEITKKTGLPVDPYFSGSKIKWLMENSPEVQRAAKRDDLRFGTIDCFLLSQLTQGKAYKTEASNASRTMLYDIEQGQWDDELLAYFNIKKKYLPQVMDSFGQLGRTCGLDFLPDGIPITGILGDQQAALLGQGGLKPGDIKCTYGTGGFLLLNTGRRRIQAGSGLLSTVAYRQKGVNLFALEGSCYIAGAAVQWLRDQLGFIESSSEVEQLASKVKDISEMEFLTFLPFFTGMASPYWQPNAKAAIVGITPDMTKAHIARACLEGIALSINDIIEACQSQLGERISLLKVDGGMCQNNLFCQIQSDVSGLTVQRPQIIETTAYGAALAAAIGAEAMSLQGVERCLATDQEFSPGPETIFYQNKKNQWQQLLRSCCFNGPWQ